MQLSQSFKGQPQNRIHKLRHNFPQKACPSAQVGLQQFLRQKLKIPKSNIPSTPGPSSYFLKSSSSNKSALFCRKAADRVTREDNRPLNYQPIFQQQKYFAQGYKYQSSANFKASSKENIKESTNKLANPNLNAKYLSSPIIKSALKQCSGVQYLANILFRAENKDCEQETEDSRCTVKESTPGPAEYQCGSSIKTRHNGPKFTGKPIQRVVNGPGPGHYNLAENSTFNSGNNSNSNSGSNGNKEKVTPPFLSTEVRELRLLQSIPQGEFYYDIAGDRKKAYDRRLNRSHDLHFGSYKERFSEKDDQFKVLQYGDLNFKLPNNNVGVSMNYTEGLFQKQVKEKGVSPCQYDVLQHTIENKIKSIREQIEERSQEKYLNSLPLTFMKVIQEEKNINQDYLCEEQVSPTHSYKKEKKCSEANIAFGTNANSELKRNSIPYQFFDGFYNHQCQWQKRSFNVNKISKQIK